MSRYNTINVIGGTVYVGTVTISGASIDNKVGIDEDVFKIGDSWRSLKEDHAGNMNRDVSADGVATWYIIVIANVFNVLFYVTPHFFLHRSSEVWPSELRVRGGSVFIYPEQSHIQQLMRMVVTDAGGPIFGPGIKAVLPVQEKTYPIEITGNISYSIVSDLG